MDKLPSADHRPTGPEFKGRNGAIIVRGPILSDEGVFGIVYTGKYPESDQNVIIKVGRKADKNHQDTFTREATILTALERNQVPHITLMHSAHIDPDLKEPPYIVEDMAQGQRLDKLNKKGDVDSPEKMREGLAIFAQAGETFSAAHKAGIAYDDVKDTCFFWDGKNLTVIDWNQAVLIRGEDDPAVATNIGHLANLMSSRFLGQLVSTIYANYDKSMNMDIVKKIAELPSELRNLMMRQSTNGLSSQWPKYDSMSELLIDIKKADQQLLEITAGTQTLQPADPAKLIEGLPEKSGEPTADQLMDLNPLTHFANQQIRWANGSLAVGQPDEAAGYINQLNPQDYPLYNTEDMARGMQIEISRGAMSDPIRERLFEPYKFITDMLARRSDISSELRSALFKSVRALTSKGSLKHFAEAGEATLPPDIEEIKKFLLDNKALSDQLGIPVPKVLLQFLPGHEGPIEVPKIEGIDTPISRESLIDQIKLEESLKDPSKMTKDQILTVLNQKGFGAFAENPVLQARYDQLLTDNSK